MAIEAGQNPGLINQAIELAPTLARILPAASEAVTTASNVAPEATIRY